MGRDIIRVGFIAFEVEQKMVYKDLLVSVGRPSATNSELFELYNSLSIGEDNRHQI